MIEDRRDVGAVVHEVGVVAAVDEAAELADVAIAVAGGERVVELVDREDRAHAHRVVAIELGADVRVVADGRAGRRGEEAVEQVRGLDAEDDGELAAG